MMLKEKLGGAIALLIGCCCLFFTAYPLLVKPVTLGEVVTQYTYFTDQVVVLCGVYLILTGLYCFGVRSLGAFVFQPYVKTGITVYILTVGITYYIGVVPFTLMGHPEGLFVKELQSVFMHLGVPVFMTLLYYFTPVTSHISLPKSMLILIYPFVYFVYLFLYTITTGNSIYPFLNMEIVGSWGIAALCFIAITVGMCAIGLLTIRGYNRKWRRECEKTVNNL